MSKSDAAETPIAMVAPSIYEFVTVAVLNSLYRNAPGKLWEVSWITQIMLPIVRHVTKSSRTEVIRSGFIGRAVREVQVGAVG